MFIKSGKKTVIFMRTYFLHFVAGVFLFSGFLLSQVTDLSAQDNVENSLPEISTQEKPDKYVKIRLLPERGSVAPGEEIWIGVEQSIHEGWHTYWANPGDSGSRPSVEWDLPDGFSVSAIQWPTPQKLPYGPLLNYGYEDNVILLQKLRLPDSLPEGAIKLEAGIEVLVCKDICIPEYDTYTLVLNDPLSEREDNSAYLAAARERLPVSAPEPATVREKGNLIRLELPGSEWCEDGADGCDNLVLYPYEWGILENTAEAKAFYDDETLVIEQEAGNRALDALEQPPVFVIGYKDAQGGHSGITFATEIAAPLPGERSESTALFGAGDEVTGNIAPELPSTAGQMQFEDFMGALLFALLGGIILNLMPCVFPVLSMKALSLVKTANKHPGKARLHGIAYTLGVVISFLAVAALLILLQAGGSRIGWGFQLQNPVVVGALAYLLFVIGLNLSGFFEIGSGLMRFSGRFQTSEGIGGSFLTGILATLVATPCTAPFMGAAIGFALTQGWLISLSVFAALGFGLALPYLLLSFVPALRHILPKPGRWMEIFKQFLAFPMFASAVWLVWVLSQQAGSLGVLAILSGMVFIGFGLWLFRVAPEHGRLRVLSLVFGVISLVLAFGMVSALSAPGIAASQSVNKGAVAAGQPSGSQNQETTQQKFGEEFSPARLEQALATDQPVFVEMTAAWCITCKVNHATSLNISSTKTLFQNENVIYLIGDWTNYNAEITDYLESFGRNGVPIYVFYGAPDENGQRPEPELLPQILTPAIVADTVGS